jgi:purine-binding chemotaxis protein CheW
MTDVSELEKYLTFVLADEEYGIEILRVREIIGFMDVTPVPQTPDFVKGVINLRGEVIPVIDLRVKFGMPEGEVTEETCIIVAEVKMNGSQQARVQMGIVVDTVQEVLDIPASNISPAPEFGADIKTEYIQGMGKVDDEVKILLDIDRVLSEEEFVQLDKVQQQAG